VKPAVIDLLSPLKAKVDTLTSDHGKEFAQHKSIKPIWLMANQPLNSSDVLLLFLHPNDLGQCH
jgi:hypothetical protein